MHQKDIVIFGNKDLASLAHFYIKQDAIHNRVVAFTLSKDYMPDDKTFEGLPIVPFEELEDHYDPKKYQLFAPISDNKFRAKIYLDGKNRGYDFFTYISSKATMFPGSEIGENCFILEDNTVQPFTPIGNNCILWSGNHIGHHGVIKDHVFFTSHVVMSGHVTVEPYSFFGVNSTIRDGITIAEGSIIAMGALVTKSTEAYGVYIGSPAKKKGEK